MIKIVWISQIEAERMKFWRCFIKASFEPAKENFPPAIFLAVKRTISMPDEEDLKFLRKIHSEEEIEQLKKDTQTTLGWFYGLKKKLMEILKEKAIKVFNLKVEKNKAEIYEWAKFRSFDQLYPVLMLVSKSIGWMYALDNNLYNDKEGIENALKKIVSKGFYKGIAHYQHYVEEEEKNAKEKEEAKKEEVNASSKWETNKVF